MRRRGDLAAAGAAMQNDRAIFRMKKVVWRKVLWIPRRVFPIRGKTAYSSRRARRGVQSVLLSYVRGARGARARARMYKVKMNKESQAMLLRLSYCWARDKSRRFS